MAEAQPRAILFDLDDTLLDDTGNFEQLWRDAVLDGARALPSADAEGLLAEIERVRVWYWSDPERHRQGRQDLRAATRHIVATAMKALGFDDPEVATRIAHDYRDRRDANLRLFPEAIETLARVRATGIRTALLTNGSAAAQRAKVERFGLAPHFDAIFIEGEFGVGKPHEAVYRAALEALRTAASEAWMVGDNLEWDVAAPQRLGVRGIWVDRHGRGLPPDAPARPTRIIRHVGEL